MSDTASPVLAAWASFCVMAGSSAAALTGLMFVVVTLMRERERGARVHETHAAFSTPTVMHFVAAMLVSAVLVMPWRTSAPAGIVTALIGLSGVAYILRVMHRTSRLSQYAADLEDWTWYTILPFVAYGALSAGAIALAAARVQALFILAGSVLFLILIGIRNAWDLVTYIAFGRG